jgi:hypothetical protein
MDVCCFPRQRETAYIEKEKFHSAEGQCLKKASM